MFYKACTYAFVATIRKEIASLKQRNNDNTDVNVKTTKGKLYSNFKILEPINVEIKLNI